MQIYIWIFLSNKCCWLFRRMQKYAFTWWYVFGILDR